MTENDSSSPSGLIFQPCARAFFVYYVAMALVFLGPRLNPEAGLPVWLGTLLGCVIVAVVIYLKYGTEYRVTSQGVVRTWRWPSPRRHEIAWDNLGEIQVLRGLTQTMLQVGNLSFPDKSGGPEMFWYGLPQPQDVRDLINRRRP